MLESVGCILAEDIKAGSDYLPFNRSKKDGIAVQFSAIEKQTVVLAEPLQRHPTLTLFLQVKTG